MQGYVQKAAILNRPTRAKHLKEHLSGWNVWVPCDIKPPFDSDPIQVQVTFDVVKHLRFSVYVPSRHVMFSNSKYLKHSLPLPCLQYFQKMLQLQKEVTSAPDYWSKSKDTIEQYIEVLSGMLERHEPVIRGKGVPVWSIVAYAQKRNLTPEQVSQIWANYISPVEVRAALEYYKRHPEQFE